jgi:hypothetical protein
VSLCLFFVCVLPFVESMCFRFQWPLQMISFSFDVQIIEMGRWCVRARGLKARTWWASSLEQRAQTTRMEYDHLHKTKILYMSFPAHLVCQMEHLPSLPAMALTHAVQTSRLHSLQNGQQSQTTTKMQRSKGRKQLKKSVQNGTRWLVLSSVFEAYISLC